LAASSLQLILVALVEIHATTKPGNPGLSGTGQRLIRYHPRVQRALVGQRVARKNSDELGTVVEVDGGTVKVKWDRGRTSYYRPAEPANVKLAESQES
jgi:hypothetical protein